MAQNHTAATLALAVLFAIVLFALQGADARFLPSGGLPTNRLPPSLNPGKATAVKFNLTASINASISNLEAALKGFASSLNSSAHNLESGLKGFADSLNSMVSDLVSSLNATLHGKLQVSVSSLSLSSSTNPRPSAAHAALLAQISALEANLDSLNATLANINTLPKIDTAFQTNDFAADAAAAALAAQISAIKSSISAIIGGSASSIQASVIALNQDLAAILGSAVSSAGILPKSAAVRAVVRERLTPRVASVTQTVSRINANVSAVAGAVNALLLQLTPLIESLPTNGAVNGAISIALSGVVSEAVSRALNGTLPTNVANLLPQQGGMLRGVLSSCNGLQTLQAGVANIQILKIGSTYLVTYYLYAAGVTTAPGTVAIYNGSPCSSAAAASSVALSLPGTWQLMGAASWSLSNVASVAEADVAEVLAAIQGITNDDMYLGFSGANGVLSGKLIGGRY